VLLKAHKKIQQDSMCWFSHRRWHRKTRTVYLFTDEQCDKPTSCVVTQLNVTFWYVGTWGWGQWPPNSNSGEISVQCT